MPSYLADPDVDEQRLGEALNGPSSYGASISATMGGSQLTPWLTDLWDRTTGAPGALLSADDANQRFGVPGYLTFEKPTSENDAAVESGAAHQKAFRADVMSRSTMGPLGRIGFGMLGGLLDPAGMALFALPEIAGLRGAIEGATAARGLGVVAGAGRLANAGRAAIPGAIEGAAGMGLYETADYGLHRYGGDDDMTLGDALSGVALGAVLGAGFGAVHGAFGHLPAKAAALSEEGRLGAHALALEDAIGDRPVDVADLIDRETATPTDRLAALDEAGAEPAFRAQMLDRPEGDVAVTTRGTEVPVRYAVAELGDLTTSHTDDLQPNPGYPQALQPRDRTRAGSQAANLRLEAELNPKRLMFDLGAESGAPLVSPQGVVESGNGRTIALRRSAATDGAAYGRYLDELKAQGIDTTGFERPALVRIRSQAMAGEDRASLAREMNADATERMGASEQAAADALRLDAPTLQALDDTAPTDPAFVRKFIARVAPDQQNTLADAGGRLSAEGARRVKAALTAYAYEDPRLTAALYEGEDTPLRQISEALADVAPRWAKLRALAAAGEIPPELDLTPQLSQAVGLIREARETRTPLAQLAAERFEAGDLFDKTQIGAKDFLDVMFRDADYKRPRAADKVSGFLDDYARNAMLVEPGPQLFGDDLEPARRILDHLSAQFAGKEAFPTAAERVRPPAPREPVVAGLEPAEGGRPGRPGAGEDHGAGPGGEAGGPGGGPGERAAVAPRPDPMANVDPDLKALAERDLADAPAPKPEQDPDTIAEAIRAAAFCLREGGA